MQHPFLLHSEDFLLMNIKLKALRHLCVTSAIFQFGLPKFWVSVFTF